MISDEPNDNNNNPHESSFISSLEKDETSLDSYKEDIPTKGVWCIFDDYITNRQDSVSFGECVSFSTFPLNKKLKSKYIIVSAPLDDGYGKVFIFEGPTSITSFNFELLSTIEFKNRSDIKTSFHQQPGHRLQSNILCAPYFKKDVSSMSPEGAFFMLNDFKKSGELYHLHHLRNKRTQAFVENNDIFCYRHPWMFVTKKRSDHKHFVDVYKLKSKTLCFHQTLKCKKDEELFGSSICCNSTTDCVIIQDTMNCIIYVYIYYPKKKYHWQPHQKISYDEFFSDKIDLNQSLSMSDNGATFAIASPNNEMILIYKWNENDTMFTLHQTIDKNEFSTNVFDRHNFGSLVKLSPSEEWMIVSEKETACCLHVFKYCYVSDKYCEYQIIDFTDKLKDNVLESEETTNVWFC